MSRAQIVAETFVVSCPTCREPVAEPETGSHVWEFYQLVIASGKPEGDVTCACGASLTVVIPKRFSA